jgi:hypothetical protein
MHGQSLTVDVVVRSATAQRILCGLNLGRQYALRVKAERILEN